MFYNYNLYYICLICFNNFIKSLLYKVFNLSFYKLIYIFNNIKSYNFVFFCLKSFKRSLKAYKYINLKNNL
jgi:hypothetical protein